jgi:mannose/fructose/sorbose-specific phosphotransferase system IIA component
MGVHIVVAGHGDFPQALCASAQMIVGRLDGVDCVGLFPGMGLQDFIGHLAEVVGDGVTLIVTDLRGGTPDNAARLLARRSEQVRVISNVTLGLLLEVLTWADLESHSMDDLCQLAGPHAVLQTAI